MAILRTHMFVWAVVLLWIDWVNTSYVKTPWPSATPWHKHGGYPLLMEATIETLTTGLNDNDFTSVDLVKAYLARIAEVNGTLHAVTEINPDALDIAAELDTERSKGNVRGPLHGIPILIKNNIATMDKMNNTAGSYALLGARVPRDSTIASKLRAAGAIILGKANLSQWANFRSANSSNGWSAYGGQVYGPFYPNQDPSGSSSGSAVSSTLGLALAALGTETDGSIISPSSLGNLVGIKPSVGLTSRNLVIPISEHQDTVGPMARTVTDAAIILQTIAGVDPYDNYTSAIPNNGSLPDYKAACTLTALAGARIGIPRNVLEILADGALPTELAAFESAVGVLKTAGATIVDNTNFTAAAAQLNSTSEIKVLNADFLVDLANYLALLTENPNKVTSLAGVRNFTQTFPLEDYPDRDTAVWDDALDTQGWNNTDPRFWAAYQEDLYFGGDGGLFGAITRNNLDAVILPSDLSPTWAAIVGAPIVTVPLGATPQNITVVTSSRGLVESGPNLPFGLSFLGLRFTEAKLIGYAYAFEQRTKVRSQIHPYIAPSTEIKDVVEDWGAWSSRK